MKRELTAGGKASREIGTGPGAIAARVIRCPDRSSDELVGRRPKPTPCIRKLEPEINEAFAKFESTDDRVSWTQRTGSPLAVAIPGNCCRAGWSTP